MGTPKFQGTQIVQINEYFVVKFYERNFRNSLSESFSRKTLRLFKCANKQKKQKKSAVQTYHDQLTIS